jgi:hypothetical protein
LFSLKRASRPGLLFASIPLVAAMYDAYEVAGRGSEPQVFSFVYELVPRLGLALIVAFAVFCLFQAALSVLLRLDHVSVAAQAATRGQSSSLTTQSTH